MQQSGLPCACWHMNDWAHSSWVAKVHCLSLCTMDLLNLQTCLTCAYPGAGGALSITGAGTSLAGSGLLFFKNAALDGSGGALASGPNTTLRLTASFWSMDSASRHGGSIAVYGAKAADLVSSNITESVAGAYGGGVYVRETAILNAVGISVLRAVSGLGGGGMAVWDVGMATIQNCSVSVGGPLAGASSSSSAALLQALTVRRQLQQGSTPTSTAAPAGGSDNQAASGGGLLIAGNASAAVVGTQIYLSEDAKGWRGAGVALRLDPAAVCSARTSTTNTPRGATSTTTSGPGSGPPCAAVVLLQTSFDAAASYAPGPTDRPLFSDSLDGWTAACEPSGGAGRAPPPAALSPPPRPANDSLPQAGAAMDQARALLQGVQSSTLGR